MSAKPLAIYSPAGKPMTARQYLALHRAVVKRRGDGHPCEHTHFGCAAWEGGPCNAEVASTLPPEADER
jgi:hypothetical protein